MTAPIVPPPVTAPMPPISRGALGRLATGLVAYGLIGLAIALIGLFALLYAGQRIGGLADRTGEQVESLIATLDQTAVALDDAGSTALSFAVTLERTPPIVRQAATTVGNLTDNLQAVAAQLAGISILGNRPLEDVSVLFAQMAADLQGLDTRLDLVASELEGNRDALLGNADSLRALGAEVADVADGLREGFVEDSLADVQVLLTILFLLLVAWTAVPAAGALGVGLWLRRELARSGGA
jgi:hypothetical protein